MIKIFGLTIALLSTCSVMAVETEWHGLVDFRLGSADTIDSYVDGGMGKFGQSDGQHLALSQLGAELALSWDSGISGHLVANAYLDREKSGAGLTEAYLKYRSLPNAAGLRWQSKAGIFYPAISLENNAFAWASKNTLNSSTLNTWLGEEVRVLGAEFMLTRLGKLHNSKHDFSLSGAIFGNNDPAGALLAWHGWTMSSRQTLWTERLFLPDFEASRPGNMLSHQAKESDPFLELDDRLGFHVKARWKYRGKGEFSSGYYDNNGRPYIVKKGQYAWKTRFYHVGAKWRLAKGLELSGQYLNGRTLMQSPQKMDVVNNDYASGYLALTKKWRQHQVTLRGEEFSVTDNDNTPGDNNNEYGKAMTVNYRYQYQRNWFFSGEFNWIDSNRPARWYIGQPVALTERQLQFSARYFF
ncbi:hypothetical protein SG34_002920 [Thalassomonas viridans]|uniref:Porin n=1 Tax=Thalassomonas viridans TaxID=137584 RepID=A0AAE9Z4G5_9GAMM|nr:hypothetical protein [Thalassomonas viridans]WDE05900.1 hypothetical protein SG34_002920 [Thalassomonas viridans]